MTDPDRPLACSLSLLLSVSHHYPVLEDSGSDGKIVSRSEFRIYIHILAGPIFMISMCFWVFVCKLERGLLMSRNTSILILGMESSSWPPPSPRDSPNTMVSPHCFLPRPARASSHPSPALSHLLPGTNAIIRSLSLSAACMQLMLI